MEHCSHYFLEEIMMQWQNVYGLPLASNVCDQALREVETQKNWSMAHVVMQPGAYSLHHKHETISEIYAITKGLGELVVGKEVYKVGPGNVFFIPKGTPHMILNGAHTLEHLVFAFPPFLPDDVVLLDEKPPSMESKYLPLPDPEECFDGATIRAYEFPEVDVSIAYGSVAKEPEGRKKLAHFHKHTHEWAYVIQGKGYVEIEGRRWDIRSGDWIQFSPNESHAFRNDAHNPLELMCVCSPRFHMEDVHYVLPEGAQRIL
jgi:quercetin dioxygenase-like cupin family protein